MTPPKVHVFAEQLPDSNEGRALVGEVRVPSPDGAVVLTGGLPSQPRLHVQLQRIGPLGGADRGAGDRAGAVPDLRIGLPAEVKAVLMSLISISASLRWSYIFQQGHLESLLGPQRVGRAGRMGADDHVRDPVRPLHGLRGAAAVAIRERYLPTATTPGRWPRGSG